MFVNISESQHSCLDVYLDGNFLGTVNMICFWLKVVDIKIMYVLRPHWKYAFIEKRVCPKLLIRACARLANKAGRSNLSSL